LVRPSEGDIKRLKSNDVSNIIQRGGTILKSARSMEFRTPEGRTKAAQMLAEHKIDALVVINNIAYIIGFQSFDISLDQSLITTEDTICFTAIKDSCPDYSPNGSIHSRSITS